MITEYNHPNEVAYVETKPKVYRVDEIMTFMMIIHEKPLHPMDTKERMCLINRSMLT